MTPLFRALLVASLDYDGVQGPHVTEDGRFSDESGGDLLHAEDGLTLIAQALVRADAAIGATIGKQVLEAVAQRLGVESAVDVLYDDLSSEVHIFSNAIATVANDAARALLSQSSTEVVPYG